jgi:cyclopropane fatty-acyl-phospholipid synthase-like methyltransferase
VDPKEIVAAGYDGIAEQCASWEDTAAWPAARWVQDVDALLGDGAHVLDLGCGPGMP